jgi:RNA polymerase sigma factor (sigma-70 family)
VCVAELSFVIGAARTPRRARSMTGVAQLSDEALIGNIARSDESALAELYDRYGHAAYGLALRVLRDPNLAEDAVQEAFLHVWRSAERFEAGRSKVGTWVLTFVHRRAVDLVRREERRRVEPAEHAAVATGPGADEEAERLSKREIVQEALRRLPPEQREAIELAYYGGYTQSELAERLGEPLGTIKSRMFTGLQRLRSFLDEAGFEVAGP